VNYPHSLNVRSGIVGSDVLNAEARMGTPLSVCKCLPARFAILVFFSLLCISYRGLPYLSRRLGSSEFWRSRLV
jgi:hypothetical protein